MALLTKVKTRMAVHAHRKVRGLLDGAYASVQLGRSMDFFDLREYVTGDDVKDIDWKASARRGDLLVKRFVADRKHTIALAVSASRTMAAMCDADATKGEVATLAAGVLGWLAIRHGDSVTLTHGNSDGVQGSRPSSREDALERMLQSLDASCLPGSPDPDLTGVLEHVVRTVRRRTILVVIADDANLDETQRRLLNRLRAQHEVLFLTIGDLDPTDPALGRALVDQPTGQAWPGFLRDATLHEEAAQRTTERHALRAGHLDRLGIAHGHIATEAEVVGSIFALLERHRQARR